MPSAMILGQPLDLCEIGAVQQLGNALNGSPAVVPGQPNLDSLSSTGENDPHASVSFKVELGHFRNPDDRHGGDPFDSSQGNVARQCSTGSEHQFSTPDGGSAF